MKTIVAKMCIPWVIFFLLAHPARAMSMPASKRADNCTLRLQLYNKLRPEETKVTTTETAGNLALFDEPYLIEIADRKVPVFKFKKRSGKATLIVLLHQDPDSTSEKPIVDGVCHDYTGHNLIFVKATKTIDFSSDPEEEVFLRFRVDPETLPKTMWMATPADSISMVEILPGQTPHPPTGNDWCKDHQKDVKTAQNDLWFTMCVQHAAKRTFEYTLQLRVGGKTVIIDPQIINRPF